MTPCQHPKVAALRNGHPKQKPERLHRTKPEEQCHKDTGSHYFYDTLRDDPRTDQGLLARPSIVGARYEDTDDASNHAKRCVVADQYRGYNTDPTAERQLLFDDAPSLLGP